MKKLIYLSFFAILSFLYSCSSQINIDPKTLEEITTSNQFTFMAERANPSNYDVINVMNSMPNSISTRMLNLDYGYTIVVKDKELDVTLPYFGRMYNPSYDNSKNSYRFTSKDFTLSKILNKKDNLVYTISPKDVDHVKVIFIEVYKNGNAYVSIDSNDRQPISYNGYLMKNEISKK
jgi:hypothetical protein